MGPKMDPTKIKPEQYEPCLNIDHIGTKANSEDPNSGISSVSALFIKIFTNFQVTNKL